MRSGACGVVRSGICASLPESKQSAFFTLSWTNGRAQISPSSILTFSRFAWTPINGYATIIRFFNSRGSSTTG
jgi:hypothetical protein